MSPNRGSTALNYRFATLLVVLTMANVLEARSEESIAGRRRGDLG